MRKQILILGFILTGWACYAQTGSVQVGDSLILRLKHGTISVGLANYAVRYDSAYMVCTQRVRELLPGVLSQNGGNFPGELRYIRNDRNGEYLRFYTEPEPENANWAEQQQRMADRMAHAPDEIWLCRISDQSRGVVFTLTAADSNAMKELLQTNLTLHHAQYSDMINALNRRKSKPYLVRIKDQGNGIPEISHRSQILEPYHIRVGMGPVILGDQIGLGFSGEISRIFYTGRIPQYRVGLGSMQHFSNFTGDGDRWSRLIMSQVRFVKMESDDRFWRGVKLGYGGMEVGGKSIFPPARSQAIITPPEPSLRLVPFVSFGFALENTKLADFDIDFIYLLKRNVAPGEIPVGIPIMLTMKLPF
jgi:hypothetical protein